MQVRKMWRQTDSHKQMESNRSRETEKAPERKTDPREEEETRSHTPRQETTGQTKGGTVEYRS